MSEPFLGEIIIFGGTFAPYGWAFCQGQTLAISSNQALFALIGTYYGGNGTTNFQLPDLRSRVPVGFGQGVGLSDYAFAQTGGTETVTLLTTQMPVHNHPLAGVTGSGSLQAGNGAGTTAVPNGNYLANCGDSSGQSLGITGFSFAPQASAGTLGNLAGLSVTLTGGTVGNTGGSQAHTNLQPYLAVNYIIALQGVFPTRN